LVSDLIASARVGCRKLCKTISEASTNWPDSFSRVEVERYEGARYSLRKVRWEGVRPGGGGSSYCVKGLLGAAVYQSALFFTLA
jgi:hypothetical protein